MKEKREEGNNFRQKTSLRRGTIPSEIERKATVHDQRKNWIYVTRGLLEICAS